MRVTVASFVIVLAMALIVSGADATIVVGQGVAGVYVGDSIAKVKQKLGKPTRDTRTWDTNACCGTSGAV